MGSLFLYSEIIMIDLDSMIEDAIALGYKVQFRHFSEAVNKLTLPELKHLAELVGIRFASDDDDRLTREELIDVMDETTWHKFMSAYLEVTGHSFDIA